MRTRRAVSFFTMGVTTNSTGNATIQPDAQFPIHACSSWGDQPTARSVATSDTTQDMHADISSGITISVYLGGSLGMRAKI